MDEMPKTKANANLSKISVDSIYTEEKGHFMQVKKAVGHTQELNLLLIALEAIAPPVSKYVSFFSWGTK